MDPILAAVLAALAAAIATWLVLATHGRRRDQQAQEALAQAQQAASDALQQAEEARHHASEARQQAAVLGERCQAQEQRADDLQARLGQAERERASLASDGAEWQRQNAIHETAAAHARTRLEELEGRLAAVGGELARATAEVQELRQRTTSLQEQLAASERLAGERERNQADLREQLKNEVAQLGQQLLDTHGKALLGEGKLQLDTVLVGFKERIAELQAQVGKHHESDVQERAVLKNELDRLLQAQSGLRHEAEQLSRALVSDTKKQGTWGELTLERLLEASQLERGVAYDLQVNGRNEDGSLGRPDAVIFLPEERFIVVDAKVSLTAYHRACGAGEEAERATALAEHAASVLRHAQQLAGRRYPDLVLGEGRQGGRILDTVLLFLPSEPAFAAAMHHDPELWRKAFDQGVVLVCPSSLMATLRVINQLWRVEHQQRNSARIAAAAEGLLDKLAGFLKNFEAVGNQIATLHTTFERAQGQLMTGKGNLLSRARRMAGDLGNASLKDETRKRLGVGNEDDEAEGQEG